MLVFGQQIDCKHSYWCHTTLESTFNAIFTVETAVITLFLDLQSAGWSEGKTMAQELM